MEARRIEADRKAEDAAAAGSSLATHRRAERMRTYVFQRRPEARM